MNLSNENPLHKRYDKDNDKFFNLANPLEWKEYNDLLDQIEIDNPESAIMDRLEGVSVYYSKNDYSDERRDLFERLRIDEDWLINTFQGSKLDELLTSFIQADKALKGWPAIEQWDNMKKHDTDPMELAENRNAYLTHIATLEKQRNDLLKLIQDFKACIVELNKIRDFSNKNSWIREARKAESILLFQVKNIIKKDNLSEGRYMNDFMDRYPLTPSTVTI